MAPAGHQPPHILRSGVVSPQQVEALFRIYFDYMNLSCSLLDPVLYTAHNTYWRSPFLFTVVCAIASRYDKSRPALYEELMNYAQLAAGTALINGPKNVEVVAAYILLSLYPVPMRRWEEDRTWLYLGLAIRVATDINLNRAPANMKPRTEQQIRESLNRTRVWINCFNLDRSTSSWHGKASTLNNADPVANASGTWYNSSPHNVGNFDIQLVAYNAELRLMNNFSTMIRSSPNKKADIDQLATETDEKLTALGEEWKTKLQTETDLSDPQNRFRNSLVKLAYSYARLVVLSQGFQHSLSKSHQDENPYFHRCRRAACDVVRVFIDELSTQKVYLRHGPDAQCVFVTFASSFLVKLLHPKYAEFLSMDQRIEIRTLVQGIIDLLSSPEIFVDDRHAPKQWSKFLAGLLDTPMAKLEVSPNWKSGASVSRRRSARKSKDSHMGSQGNSGRPSDSPPNPNMQNGPTSPPSSGQAASYARTVPLPPQQYPQQNYAGPTSPQSYHPSPAEQSPGIGFADSGNATFGENALQMQFPEYFQPPLAFDGDFFASMQSMPDPSIWQNMTMTGFNWMDVLHQQQTPDSDTQMMDATINPGLLHAENSHLMAGPSYP
ncbi:hypothetical protein BD410DRAFT_776153 [Rickenella mellea]|uniref:Xylanolytic transcriptional activator regulatory domain-containing protein n=1 Tax=Rickenella mellea TaxID=50990 RepID=A0A4Y7PS26_9AGAM|nr:hypothetical protein BD410DRAFT_776153 [Rickenella mellea]